MSGGAAANLNMAGERPSDNEHEKEARESTVAFPPRSLDHNPEAATQGSDTSPSCESVSECVASDPIPSRGQKAWDLCRGVLLDTRTERAARLTAPLIFWYCVTFIPKLADAGPGVW